VLPVKMLGDVFIPSLSPLIFVQGFGFRHVEDDVRFSLDRPFFFRGEGGKREHVFGEGFW